MSGRRKFKLALCFGVSLLSLSAEAGAQSIDVRDSLPVLADSSLIAKASFLNAVTAQAAASSAASSNSPGQATDLAYQDLRTMWDHCNHLKSTALDLLNEGRNAPSRQKWVAFYVSSAKDDLSALKTAITAMHFPSSVSGSTDAPWSQVQSIVQQLDGVVARIDTEAQNMKSPTDDKYPPIFWKSSGEFSEAADKLDKSLISIFSIMDSNISQSAPALSGQIAANSSSTSADTSKGEPLQGGARMVDEHIGFKKIAEASSKISKSCWGLFGELERWNLLYGKPPEGGIGDGFYGGGLSKSEVLSEYKYLPQFTFTNAPYVMLYSYRLPPRQNMLAYHTGQIGKLMNLMEAELNDVQVPADRQQALAGPWEETKKLFLDCRTDYLALLNLVNNTSDERLAKNIREDQTTFGQPLMGIYSDMAKMRNALDDINKILK